MSDDVAVWGKSKISGMMEILSHEKVVVREYVYKWIFFGKQLFNREILKRKEQDITSIANDAWQSGNYSDVWMIVDNVDPEGWHIYRCSCCWRNGEDCNYSVNTTNIFRFYPYG